MKYEKLNTQKGVAGLNILLAVITMLFVIGILVMSFVLVGNKLTDASVSGRTNTGVFQANVNLTISANGAEMTRCSAAIDGSIAGIESIINQSNGVALPANNYSLNTNASFLCYINGTDSVQGADLVNVTYTLARKDNQAVYVIGNTTAAIDDVIDWFPIFIVFAALVVLILLLVIVIISIRGSGISGEGGA